MWTTNSSTQQTRVVRSYRPGLGGQVKIEQIYAIRPDGTGGESFGQVFGTNFDYDAQGRLVTIDYPSFDGGTLQTLIRVYGKGRLVELKGPTFSDAAYEYRGHQVVRRTLLDGQGGTSAAYTGTDTLDEFGRLVSRSDVGNALSLTDDVGVSGGAPYDPDGRILGRSLENHGASYSYLGDGWLESKVWNRNLSTVYQVSQQMTLNDFGGTTDVAETRNFPFYGGGGAPATSDGRHYDRDLAGFLTAKPMAACSRTACS